MSKVSMIFDFSYMKKTLLQLLKHLLKTHNFVKILIDFKVLIVPVQNYLIFFKYYTVF